ncbi:ABC transporter permease [Cohnella thailandensis]|uniref:ABC transporter permease n=1 Tax=Cohnella thailandensis TaxID=557557 RepID=A0A841SYU5_9BACL|nr:ABC transporter permease [Cohnella thailandensis]MBB6634787.1 ABC transporter permease [Cohnella thailandensis]MBP1975992.1 sulfonate transport system permease protein [Cohnella thailandensis]
MSIRQANAAAVPTAGRKRRKAEKTRRKLSHFLWGAILPATILIVWQVLGDRELISPLLFPTPLVIADSFVWLWNSGTLNDNLFVSLYRTFAGFGLGAGLGLALGLFVGLSRSAEKLLDSTVQMIRMIPHISVTFLFVLWFGIGDTSKILLIAKGCFFPLYIYSFLGVRGVDNKLFEVTRVLGYSRFKQLVRLVLPATLPNVILGLRLSLAIAWVSLVVAEMMGASSGLGFLMMDARAMSDTPTVFVGIFLFTLLAKITDSLVLFAERRLLAWRDSFER